MVEVPEHLLQRSRDRRKALGFATDDDGAGVPQAAPTESANAPAVANAAPPPAAGSAPLPVPPKAEDPPPPPAPPWVEAAQRRRKVPYWVMPVLLFLPIWAIMYVGTLEDPTREEGIIYEGGLVYAEAGCSSCHGAGGGGGSGPAFSNGAVVETFPTVASQVEWVVKGTNGFLDEGRASYGATNKPTGGGGVMPAFHEELSPQHLIEVVFYERVELGGYAEELPLAEAWYDMADHGEIEFPDSFAPDVTLAEIEAVINPALELLGDEAAAG